MFDLTSLPKCSVLWRLPYKQIAVLAIASAIGTLASAGTISTVDVGGANFGTGSVGYGGTGWLTPNPSSNTAAANVYIGGDSMTTANRTYNFSATGQFNVWCVDIYHWLSTDSVYNVLAPSDLAAVLSGLRPGTPTGTTRVNDLLELADEDYSSVNTATSSAAFQLAVWEIAYGTPNGAGVFNINSTDTAFHVDAATLSANFTVLANNWLAQLTTAPLVSNYSMTYLSDAGAENTQDMIVFTRVPEPGTWCLMAMGLFAACGYRSLLKARSNKVLGRVKSRVGKH